MTLLARGLDPGPDRARELLQRELQDPRYRPDLLERLGDWFGRRVSDLDGGGVLGALGRPLLLAVLVVLVVGAALLVARLRRDPRVAAAGGAVFDDVRRTAAEHRALAHAARADGDLDSAVVEGLRAIAAELVERQVVTDTPAATAREVADVAAPRFPALAGRLAEAARVFDETRYGGRTADRPRADLVLDLDEDVRRAAPTAAGPGPVLAVPR